MKDHSFLNLQVRLWGLLMSAGVVACIATVFGFLGKYHWFLDLFSHFRVQYLLGLLIFAILFLIRRWKITALVFIICASLDLVDILPMYFGSPAEIPDGQQTMRAMLLNVNTEHGDPVRVRKAIEQESPDILVLEEISKRWIKELDWLTETHPHSRIQPREDNFGIGLYSKLPLLKSDIKHITGIDVPTIISSIDLGDQELTVIATHPLPPSGAEYSRWRNKHLEKLPDHINRSKPTLVLGDLNVVPWNYHFIRLLQRTGLIDSSKGRGVNPTWPSYIPFLWIPIDHCLHSPAIIVIELRIGNNVGSDHYPVIVDFAV
ncbi:endonuclease/exonuclease/phosphatase family protein [bacterium]|nr:endonuclease/exonuclease/phosphatase family protein [bacterium]